MPRTIDSKVRLIIDTDSNLSLIPFIDIASNLVDQLKAADTNGVLANSTLELIERWLAAHFYAHRDQLFQAESADRAGGVYQGKTDMGLKSTQYGQTAMLLDSTGWLARQDAVAMSGGVKRASVTSLHTDPCED